MEVSVDGVVKTLTVDYTLSGVGDDVGGNVTMLAAPATSTSVVRRRNMALTRSTDYQDQGALPASTLDSDLDSAVLMIQQVNEKTDRAMVLPTYVSGFSTELPTPIANYFLRVNSAGTALELASEITPGALTVTPFIETLLNDSMQADARTTLGAAASGANTDITSITGNAATATTATNATNVTGTIASAVTATTQTTGDNSTKVATTAFVRKFKQLAQIVTTQTGAVATGTTIIPFDDTIPQSTEGDQFMSLAITPTNASSTLEIEVTAFFSPASSANQAMALFQDSTANALATSSQSQSPNFMAEHTIKHVMTAGTTSETTFKIRSGNAAGYATTFNGLASARYYGGNLASRITIKEYLP